METLSSSSSSSLLFPQASPPSQQQSQAPIFMKSILLNSNLKPKTLSSFSTNFKLLLCTATTTTTTHSPITTTTTTTTTTTNNNTNTNIGSSITAKPREPRVSLSSKRDKFKVTVADAAVYKDKWLQSLSCNPLPQQIHTDPLDKTGSGWVLGIDPDTSGALALLKPDRNTCSAKVFDLPYLRMLVGKNLRKRLDAKSIVQLIRSLDAPIAYIEQSTPFPKDGKLGWWSGGFNYGLWIGILVSSGFTVIPVPSVTWKNEFKLSGNNCTKDDNRRLASVLFPSLDSQLKRKKDHGRAEALLIAAYGKGLKLPPQCQSISANSNTLVMDS